MKKPSAKKKTPVISNTEKSLGGITGKGFMPGNPGGPGRPKGSRNKLEESMLRDLCDAWEEYGAEAITAVLADHPADFLKICASLLPKQIEADITEKTVYVLGDRPLTGDEWESTFASEGHLEPAGRPTRSTN
jgi:hypothetical protein